MLCLWHPAENSFCGAASSCSPASMQGSNSLAPRFIKLRLFVTRCEPVLYNNFPKLLHAREITSHGALNSGGKSRLHIRDEHLGWSRWRRQQHVRSCALQSLRKPGTGNCPGSLCECSSAPAHVLPKPGVAPEAFPSEDVAPGVAPTALGGSFIHLHAPLSSSFLSHAALVLAGH